MERDDLESWLSDDDAIVPSSGFTAGVMDAVRREASEPPAIPFPWTRALPGMAATAVALAATVMSGMLAFKDAAASASLDGPFRSLLAIIVDVGTSVEVTWLVFATIMTAALVMLSLRLTRGHS